MDGKLRYLEKLRDRLKAIDEAVMAELCDNKHADYLGKIFRKRERTQQRKQPAASDETEQQKSKIETLISDTDLRRRKQAEVKVDWESNDYENTEFYAVHLVEPDDLDRESLFFIHEMKNNRTSLIAIASPRPQYRSLSRFSGGSLSAKIDIKITLSIPRMTSKMMRVMSGTKNSI